MVLPDRLAPPLPPEAPALSLQASPDTRQQRCCHRTPGAWRGAEALSSLVTDAEPQPEDPLVAERAQGHHLGNVP